MVKRKLTKEEALERLKHICASTEKCLYDVRKKLQDWSVSEAYDEISEVLIDENYIDEKRYAESFANDKIKFSYWGRRKVKYILSGKGISDRIIDDALTGIHYEDYRKIVEKELRKKIRSIREPDPFKKKQKTFAFAAQRGYEGDLVSEILEDFE